MNLYRIEMMTKDHYNTYMGGGYNYYVEKIDIEAETAMDAVAIAKAAYPNHVINEGYVKTVAEIEMEKAQRLADSEAFHKAEEAKRQARKAKREANEKAKADALGLTVEEYKAKVKKERAIKAVEKEIAELEEALAKAKKKLNHLKTGA